MNYYFIRARSLACGVVAGANGSSMLKDFTGEGASVFRGINPYLVEGKNTLDLSCFWPAQKDYEGGKAEVEMEIFLAKKGVDQPTPDKMLARLVFPNLDHPEVYPKLMTEGFEVEGHPNPLLEGLEERTELSARDHSEIEGVVQQFVTRAQRIDGEGLWKLASRKYQAAAIANGLSEGDAKQILIQQLKMLEQHPGAITAHCDFDEDTLYHPCYGNRIYMVHTLPDMKGAFKLTKEGRSYNAKFEVGVGYGADGWEIVL